MMDPILMHYLFPMVIRETCPRPELSLFPYWHEINVKNQLVITNKFG